VPYPYHKLTEADIAALTAITGSARATASDDISEDYYHDEMPEYGIYQPELLLEPVSAAEISAVMKYAYEHNIPVTVRGSGSGLAGGATCKYGGILLSVMRMNKIDPVDMENMTVTTEPGALLCDVADVAAAAGLFYPPDPGERTASIGGTVITNAGGMRAVRYGLTRDYVRCIEAVLPDGEAVKFSSNVVKNVTGYDLKDLIIGSEGTLCILTSVTLRLLSAPNCSHTLVIPFSSLGPCVDTVSKLLRLNFVPTAVEFIEKELLDIVETYLNKPFPDRSGEAYLIVMYDGASKDEVNRACAAAAEVCMEAGALDVKIANTADRIGMVWAVRAAVLEGMKAASADQEEADVVVPLARITEYVKTAKEIGKKYDIRVITAGHAGDGNIHTQLLRKEEMSDDDWHENTRACLEEIYAVAKEFGGQLTGEHGIGNARLEYLESFVGKRMHDLFKSVKRAFDEKNILNPGKVVELT